MGGGLEGGEALRLFGGRRGNFEQALDWKGRDGKRSAVGLGGWTGDWKKGDCIRMGGGLVCPNECEAVCIHGVTAKGKE